LGGKVEGVWAVPQRVQRGTAPVEVWRAKPQKPPENPKSRKANINFRLRITLVSAYCLF